MRRGGQSWQCLCAGGRTETFPSSLPDPQPDAIDLLDEVGGASEEMLTKVNDFMAHFELCNDGVGGPWVHPGSN